MTCLLSLGIQNTSGHIHYTGRHSSDMVLTQYFQRQKECKPDRESILIDMVSIFTNIDKDFPRDEQINSKLRVSVLMSYTGLHFPSYMLCNHAIGVYLEVAKKTSCIDPLLPVDIASFVHHHENVNHIYVRFPTCSINPPARAPRPSSHSLTSAKISPKAFPCSGFLIFSIPGPKSRK